MGLARSFKVTGIALVAMFAFGVLAPGSVQANSAPRWTVGGKTIAAGESTTFTATSTGVVALSTVGGTVAVKATNNGDCTATGSLVGSGAGSPGTNKSVVLTCKNVEVFVFGTQWPFCSVHSPGQPIGTIVTEKLESKLAWTKETGDTEVGDTFNREGNPGGSFTTLEFTGSECGISNVSVSGSMVARVERVTEDVKERSFVFPEAAIHTTWTNATPRTKATEDNLLLGAKASTLTGAFDVRVALDELWGVEPG